MYNINPKDASVLKCLLLDQLDYFRDRIANDRLTLEEIESITRIFANHLHLLGTADDFARFYGQSRTNVSSVLNRRMIEKPIRRVYHSFNAFQRIIPASWLNHKKETDK